MNSRREPIWLSWPVVLALHSQQLGEHGGSNGVRDRGLIESALDRPRNKWAYDGEENVFVLAAAYAFGVVSNHGFVDGNKRVAFLAAYTFMGLNGWDLAVSEEEVVQVMLDLASGTLTEGDFAAWLGKRSVPE